MLKLMCDDKMISVATKKDEVTVIFPLVENIPDWLIPKELYTRGRRVVTMEELMVWCEERAFPENRVDRDILLSELGLDRYDRWNIAKALRASLMTDFYWVAFKKTDQYKTHSARGRAGFEPVKW